MPLNRPYTFELAAMALAEPGQHGEIKALAERNGVDPDQFERATVILKGIKASGETLEDFVRREYIMDGWPQGYLQLDASPADTTLTTWKLGQFAEAHHRS
ncbi:hypothetical protein [Mycolicibacterium sp.]|uniref:hypothetical protein n=1 Tax=Mycolicibacterium sp. TaxID=2320850 RepID=UPI0037C69735